MVTVRDIQSALRDWPVWRRLAESPKRLDDHERRIVELEYRLHLRTAPGERCPKCGELEYRTDRVEEAPKPRPAGPGVLIRVMKCGACGYLEKRADRRRDSKRAR